jgi:Xaa-Pro aminopeptidase
MPALSLDQAESGSSVEMQIVDPNRAVDIESKHRSVSEFLETHRYDALLLQKPGNFSWFTSGADCSQAGSSQTTADLFITREARVVICSNTDSSQLFERELPGLGFQLKERPWHTPRPALVEDLCRGRTVASDTGVGRTIPVALQLMGMRIPLTVLECERLRELGRVIAHAVEATARHCSRGQTEAEIAAELSHRLIKQCVVAERIQVLADGQAQRYPHWSYGTDRIERYCTISAVGRQWGLCAGAARTVCFGTLPEDLCVAYHRTMLVQATGMYFSQPDWELFEIWNRVRRIYEKYGCRDEWQQSDQAEIIAYEACELPLVPKSEFRLSTRMPLHWHPSVGPAVAGDTILVANRQFELLTPTQDWPKLHLEVKGSPINCPDILRREA